VSEPCTRTRCCSRSGSSLTTCCQAGLPSAAAAPAPNLLQARVRQSQAGQAASARTASAHEELKARHAELQRHCAALEDRLQLYAITINALTLENAALSGRTAGSARVVPLTRREPAP
jgi:hypothetical protein